MKNSNRTLLLLLLLALPQTALLAQGKIQKLPIDQPAAWQIYRRQLETVGKDSVSFRPGPEDGMWVWQGKPIQPSVIEFDVRGENNMNSSFVGFAFNIQDEKHYEAIYLRPFNFYNPDTVRRWRAIQYIYMPGHPWEQLRTDHPGKYENRILQAPDPGKWFHVRITLQHPVIKVYVNRQADPSLVVNSLAPRQAGKVGLWLGNQSRGSFANVVVTY